MNHETTFAKAPTTFLCLSTRAFLVGYTMWSMLFSLVLAMNSEALEHQIPFLISGLFPLLGYIGVSGQSRPFLILYSGYLIAGIFLLLMSSVLGYLFLLQEDICVVLTDTMEWDYRMVYTCTNHIGTLRGLVVCTSALVIGIQVFVQGQLKKYYDYLARTTWSEYTLPTLRHPTSIYKA